MSVPERADCRCCGNEVVIAEQSLLNGHGQYDDWHARTAAAPEAFNVHGAQVRLPLYWACDECLNAGKAIRADPKAQRWCDVPAYLAYFDETRACRDCGQPYVFTKEQQQRWYETLKFWVQSRPVRCWDCSAKRKAKNKAEHRESEADVISARLRELRDAEPNAELVSEVESHLRSKFEGVKSLAIQVLGRWKSNSSLPLLKEIFRRREHLRKLTATAIASAMRPEDTEDIVEWFVSLRTYLERYDLFPALSGASADRAKPILLRVWRSADRKLKHSLLLVARQFGIAELIEMALSDPDEYVREFAETFTGQRGFSEWCEKWREA